MTILKWQEREGAKEASETDWRKQEKDWTKVRTERQARHKDFVEHRRISAFTLDKMGSDWKGVSGRNESDSNFNRVILPVMSQTEQREGGK